MTMVLPVIVAALLVLVARVVASGRVLVMPDAGGDRSEMRYLVADSNIPWRPSRSRLVEVAAALPASRFALIRS